MSESTPVRRNLALWDRVKETDPKYSKKASNGRFSFTTIDPQFQLQEATNQWGPYGDHWGMRNLDWNVIPSDIAPIMMLSCEFFYPAEVQSVSGQVTFVSFEIAVDMKIKPGDDMCKKLMTSARSKALSYLGFSADVFLGKFDDAAYVADLEKQYGDQEAVKDEILGKIKLAKTIPLLTMMHARVVMMVGQETISGDTGEMLIGAIEARREELAE